MWLNEAKLNGWEHGSCQEICWSKIAFNERIKSEEAATATIEGMLVITRSQYWSCSIKYSRTFAIYCFHCGECKGSLVAIRVLLNVSGGRDRLYKCYERSCNCIHWYRWLLGDCTKSNTRLSKIDPVVDKTQQAFAAFGVAIDVKTTILKFVDAIKSLLI